MFTSIWRPVRSGLRTTGTIVLICFAFYFLILPWGKVLASTPGTTVTQAKYIQELARKLPACPILPPGASALSANDLHAAVCAAMQDRGIEIPMPKGADSPLTRLDFIDITYAFLTDQPAATNVERKYFLKDRNIVKPEDIGIFKSYEGLVTATRYSTKDSVSVTGSEPLLFRDTIETDEDSRVELLFDDQSVLTLGEDTLVEINEMLYNPEEKSRDTVIRVARGALRVKAAKIPSATSNFRVETPTAVIGVRGTEFVVNVDRSGRTRVVTLEGLVAMRPQAVARQRRGGPGRPEGGEQTEEGDDSPAPEESAAEPGADEGGEVMVAANSAGFIDDGGEAAAADASAEELSQAVASTTLVNPVEVAGGGTVSQEETVEVLENGPLEDGPTEQGGPEEQAEDEEEPEDEGSPQESTPEDGGDPPTDNPPSENPLPDDSQPNPPEAGPTTPQERSRPEAADLDRDGDGVPNDSDAFPDDPTEWADSDGDGWGDNSDPFPHHVDGDGDGIHDLQDPFPQDRDNDGVPDGDDAFPDDPEHSVFIDADGDGVADHLDAFPNDPGESTDSDSDGIGDNADAFPDDPNETADSDGDGVGDNADAFPADPNETADSDGDGVGDNADAFPDDPNETADSDGDGVGDNADAYPDDPSRWQAITDVTAMTEEEVRAALDTENAVLPAPALADTAKVAAAIADNIIFVNEGRAIQFFGPEVNRDFAGIGTPSEFYDDDYRREPLGFSFPFYGTMYDEIFLTSNGWVAPVQSSHALDYPSLYSYWLYDSNYNYLLSSTYPIIAPFGTDLDPRYGGEVFFHTSESATRWRARWVKLPFYSSGSTTESSFSLTLFAGGQITFQYDGMDSDDSHGLIIGISPGSDPETGVSPSGSSIDFSAYSPGHPYIGGTNEAIFEGFDEGNINLFDLDYYGILFEPNNADGSAGYTMTPYSSSMLADPASLDAAIESDPNLATSSEIDDGAFRPSVYEYGLQVGDFTPAGTRSAIENSPLLAYAVQVEEDIVNTEALEQLLTYGDQQWESEAATPRNELWYTVDNVLDYGDIRQRDAALAEIADAKAGRVLKDANGNWLRAQQYVFRPDDRTVQVVAVNLRSDSAATLSGLTVLDWRTSFTSTLPGGTALLNLPWADYLATTSYQGSRGIANASAYELTEMAVTIRHDLDSLTEERRFYGSSYGFQGIIPGSEQLTVNDFSFAHTSDSNQWMYSGDYRVVDGAGEPYGFRYELSYDGMTPSSIEAHFHVVGDASGPNNVGVISGYENLAVRDIWQALSVNLPSSPLAIGNNNLEMRFLNGMYTSALNDPLDIVYIPLPRMEWKDSAAAYVHESSSQ